MKFANTTQLRFDPLAATAIDLVTAGDAYETDAAHRESLGDLARLSDLRARFRYSLALNQATVAGVVNIKLMAGVTEIHSFQVDASTGTRFTDTAEVDISAVAGATKIRAVVNVGTSCDAATEGTFAAVLSVEHPVIITGC